MSNYSFSPVFSTSQYSWPPFQEICGGALCVPPQYSWTPSHFSGGGTRCVPYLNIPDLHLTRVLVAPAVFLILIFLTAISWEWWWRPLCSPSQYSWPPSQEIGGGARCVPHLNIPDIYFMKVAMAPAACIPSLNIPDLLFMKVVVAPTVFLLSIFLTSILWSCSAAGFVHSPYINSWPPCHSQLCSSSLLLWSTSHKQCCQLCSSVYPIPLESRFLHNFKTIS